MNAIITTPTNQISQFHMFSRVVFYNSADASQKIYTNFRLETFTSTQTLNDFLNTRYLSELKRVSCWNECVRVGFGRDNRNQQNELLSTPSIAVFNNGYNHVSFFAKLKPKVFREYNGVLNI